jgi:hypothetical protein
LTELLEGLSVEQGIARIYAGSASPFANGAMSMVFGMPGALLSAARACSNAGLQQAMDDKVIPVGRS